MKVAIVHDWLIGGGAERVVHELHKLYPDAPIYTSYCSDEWRRKLGGKVVTGYLQHWPFSKLRKFLPVLRIWWFTRLDLSSYDLVISSSGNGEAFGVKTLKDTVHINYCHTPTHYYWRHYNLYMEQPGFGLFNPLVRWGLKLLVGPLRRWDLKASKRPDYYLANSMHTASEIKKYYGRDATVINPPIDIERFERTTAKEREGFVIAGRQVPQKKIDLAVLACTKLNLPLKVVGKGPEHQNLVRMAGPTVKFFENVTDAEMPEFFSSAEAFIFPCLDDFGITPIEALAGGTPVIAYKAGGALDYVTEGKTGLFFDEQNVDSLCKALQRFDSRKFKSDEIKKAAQKFSPQKFASKFKKFIDECLGRKSAHRS